MAHVTIDRGAMVVNVIMDTVKISLAHTVKYYIVLYVTICIIIMGYKLHISCFSLFPLFLACSCIMHHSKLKAFKSYFILKQLVIDHCSSNPCNYGRCEPKVGSYSCKCHNGYSGTNCDIGQYNNLTTCTNCFIMSQKI